MNFEVEHLGDVDSTMGTAKEKAHAGAPDGTTLVANSMSAGKGQRGHTWHAPEGGWYASIIVRDVQDPRLLTLALGNAVADILEIAGADPRLKWVNDVYVDGKKVAGVLCEAESKGNDVDFIVAGIGINLNGDTSDWPDGLDQTATTLETILGVETCIEDTEATILDCIGEWINKVRQGKGDDVLERARARDFLKGRRVRIDDVEGTAEGIDDDGHLLVDGQVVTGGLVELLD